MFQRVAAFHQAFGLPVATAPCLPDQAIRELRIRLLKEELDEFTEACAAIDRVEMADALADMCYIAAGTAVTYGVGPIEQAVFESPYHNYPGEPPSPLDMDQLLQDSFLDYELAERADNLTWIDLALMNLMTIAFGVAWRLNIPLNAVFAEVHRSNMAKLLPDGSVLRRADGKVQKPDGWQPPNIASILAA